MNRAMKTKLRRCEGEKRSRNVISLFW